jgi:superfamily II RNA helicase
LSAFVGDAKDAEKSPSMRELRVSDDLRNSLSELSTLTEYMWSTEKAAGIGFTDYWDISTFWIEIGLAWLRGDPVGLICSNYGIYEGNLYKFIMSLNNMIEELVSVATICSDVGMLERLAAVKNSVGSGRGGTGAMAFGESLYLRI